VDALSSIARRSSAMAQPMALPAPAGVSLRRWSAPLTCSSSSSKWKTTDWHPAAFYNRAYGAGDISGSPLFHYAMIKIS